VLPPVPPSPDLFLFFPGMNPFSIAAVILGMNLNVGQKLYGHHEFWQKIACLTCSLAL